MNLDWCSCGVSPPQEETIDHTYSQTETNDGATRVDDATFLSTFNAKNVDDALTLVENAAGISNYADAEGGDANHAEKAEAEKVAKKSKKRKSRFPSFPRRRSILRSPRYSVAAAVVAAAQSTAKDANVAETRDDTTIISLITCDDRENFEIMPQQTAKQTDAERKNGSKEVEQGAINNWDLSNAFASLLGNGCGGAEEESLKSTAMDHALDTLAESNRDVDVAPTTTVDKEIIEPVATTYYRSRLGYDKFRSMSTNVTKSKLPPITVGPSVADGNTTPRARLAIQTHVFPKNGDDDDAGMLVDDTHHDNTNMDANKVIVTNVIRQWVAKRRAHIGRRKTKHFRVILWPGHQTTDMVIRLPYNTSTTFQDLRRQLEKDCDGELPSSGFKFTLTGMAISRIQEQTWRVSDYSLTQSKHGSGGGGDVGTFRNPFPVYIMNTPMVESPLL